MPKLRMSAVVMMVGLVATGSSVAALDVLPTGNLVKNPGAEANAGGEFFTNRVPVNSWTMVEGAEASIQTIRYTPVVNGNAKDSRLPNQGLAAAIGGGRNFFGGWYPSRVASAFQVLDVSRAATDVDGGGVRACLSAYLGGSKGTPTSARATLEFLGEDDSRLGQIQAGPVTRGHRRDLTTMLRRAAQGVVPANTRALRVTLTMESGGGPSNYSSADNISVALTKGNCDPVLYVKCVKKALVATVTPSDVAKTQRVRFAVKGGKRTKQVQDARAPYSGRFTMNGLTGKLTVTATVAQKDSGPIVLTKKSKRC
jgi:hypothetical protein